MIVQRKQACIRIIDGVTFFPGLNGDIPDSILTNDSFKLEVEHGIMQIISQKNYGTDTAKTPINEPDMGIVDAIIRAKTNDALRMVRNTLKIATILALKEKEKRQVVLDEISKQELLLTKEKASE
jgi:hypothetical protein